MVILTGDVTLKFMEKDTRLTNTIYQTMPAVIHGNGPSKILLNSLGNYLAKSWTVDQGCMSCKEDILDFNTMKVLQCCSVAVLQCLTIFVPSNSFCRINKWIFNLENALNLTHEFFKDNFKRKFSKIFSLNYYTITQMSKLIHFQNKQ